MTDEQHQPDPVPALTADKSRGISEAVSRRRQSSNHKVRSNWFRARVSWPTREAPLSTVNAERNRVRVDLDPAATNIDWRPIGPANIGGRMTCIVCDPHNPDKIWAGAAGGGVWTSADAGRSWEPLWHNQLSLNVGSLAIDPDNPDILYCGTGEANLSADSYAGAGLYRSIDGGQSWLLIAPVENAGIPGRIGVIAIDPSDSTHLRIGGIEFTSPGSLSLGGMYVSRDGGTSWDRDDSFTPGNYWCHDIVFHPTDPCIIYTTISVQGNLNGIWRSLDGGDSWEHLQGGLPHPSMMGRTSLAIAPSNPTVLYALASQAQNITGGVLGVYRSVDGGDTWFDIQGNDFRHERQMGYNNTIIVHPHDENFVICGGVDLRRTLDGGNNWKKVTNWQARRDRPIYAHADHHALLIPAKAPNRIYDMNDGGMDVSENWGKTWENRCNGLAVTMFYDVDVAQSEGTQYGGGAQDNGTVMTSTDHPHDFRAVSDGDGGFLAIDPNDASHFFTSAQGMILFRFRGGERSRLFSLDPDEAGSMWMVAIAMDPDNTKRIFTGSQRVWLTENDGESWEPASHFFNSGDITTIEIAPQNTKRIYVGTENGGIFYSQDGGENWSGNMQGPIIPGVLITRLESNPLNAFEVVATIGNHGHSHVYMSDDGGENWRDIDGGQLPDVPHHSVVIAPDPPNAIYVASDVGVFVSEDQGASWQNLTGNLPNVMMVDLVHHQQDNTLTVATYGRSLWRLDLSALEPREQTTPGTVRRSAFHRFRTRG